MLKYLWFVYIAPDIAAKNIILLRRWLTAGFCKCIVLAWPEYLVGTWIAKFSLLLQIWMWVGKEEQFHTASMIQIF